MVVLFSVLGAIALFVLVVYIFMQQSSFGKAATGLRLERIQASPQYDGKRFNNQHHTPDLAEGATYWSVSREFFFNKSKRSKPSKVLPSKKIDLKNIDLKENVITWFGHSSYYLQIDGKRILVDPVFSGHASPVNFTTPSYAGADIYNVDDIPTLDILFISHDHWDHLDHKTVAALQPKVKTVICGLGVGAHLEHWGYDPSVIVECDWFEHHSLGDGFQFDTVPARHFSGRGLKRNQTLWISIVLTTPTMKIFLGGDSGYDTHFKAIGDQYGPFDLVILECGQYNENWKYIHLLPDQVIQAAVDLRAKTLLPVHWAKFSLALHAWDDPIKAVSEHAAKQNVSIITPMIGDAYNIAALTPTQPWWQGID